MRTYTRKRPDHQLIENVHELCRLCLCKGEGAAPIFPDDTNNVCAVLALRIMICVGLEMKREESLPNMICAECLSNLNKYYTFRKKCEVSYQKLKSHVLAVKENQYKIKMEQLNEEKQKCLNESDEEMKFVVTFEKDQLSEVSILNLNGVATKLSDLPSNTDSEAPIQESEEQISGNSPDSPGPDISTFLSTMLLQLGILVQQDNGLVFTEQSINTLELETGDGSQVMLELVEEDETEAVTEETVVMEDPPDSIEDLNSLNQNSMIISYVPSENVTQTTEHKKKSQVVESKRPGAWCNECCKAFASRSALNRHRRIHSGEKPYQCPHCGRGFSQREIMMRHMLVHEELRPHVCTTCSKSFTQRGALVLHARSHAPAHARSLTIHRCSRCPKIFLYASELRPHVCTTCSKSFTQRGALVLHARSHAPAHARSLTIHRCSRCPKIFLYASGLSRHMMTHTGRIYVCAGCDRHFKDKSSLMRHVRNTNHVVNIDIAT